MQSGSIRKNTPGKRSPGSFKLELRFNYRVEEKPRKLEFGLGTCDQKEAEKRRDIIMRVLRKIDSLYGGCFFAVGEINGPKPRS